MRPRPFLFSPAQRRFPPVFCQRSGGENTAKTLSELVIHDSRNTALSGFRLSSAIAPADRTSSEARDGRDLLLASASCPAMSPTRPRAALQNSACPTPRPDTFGHAWQSGTECDQLDEAINATFHWLPAKARAVAAPIENNAMAAVPGGSSSSSRRPRPFDGVGGSLECPSDGVRTH